MIPENRIPTHPGEMLLEEFLIPMEIPQTKFAEKLGIPVQRVNEIVNGKRGVLLNTSDDAGASGRRRRDRPA